MNKNLLIVSFDFPPAGGVAVRRLLQTIKYLDSFGWKITVLTVGNSTVKNLSLYDPGLLDKVPPSISVLPAGRRGRSKAIDRDPSGKFRALSRQILSYVPIPGSNTRWIPPAVVKGARIIERNRFRAILATGPSFQNLVVGAILKYRTGAPLVLEFRDAWVSAPNQSLRRFLRRKLDPLLESWAVRQADRVISATPGVTQDFTERYGSRFVQDKFVTIPNGYDETERVHATKRQTADRTTFRIVYAGRLSGSRTPRHFLAAARALLDRRPELAPRLRLTFVGECGRFTDGEIIENYLARYRLKENVELAGFVGRKESFEFLGRADLLLLLIGIVPAEKSRVYGLSSKVFDYALAQKPVLVVAEEGPTADFIRAAQIGEVVSHFDQAAIAHAIERAIDGKLCYRPSAETLGQYNCSHLARRLESVLMSLKA